MAPQPSNCYPGPFITEIGAISAVFAKTPVETLSPGRAYSESGRSFDGKVPSSAQNHLCQRSLSRERTGRNLSLHCLTVLGSEPCSAVPQRDGGNRPFRVREGFATPPTVPASCPSRQHTPINAQGNAISGRQLQRRPLHLRVSAVSCGGFGCGGTQPPIPTFVGSSRVNLPFPVPLGNSMTYEKGAGCKGASLADDSDVAATRSHQ